MKVKKIDRKSIFCLLLLSILSGCGGGGGGSQQPQNQFTLTITKSGTGSGTVTSTPAGINCGGACQAAFNSGTTVILNATPDANSTFDGWSGDPDCSDGQVTMDGNKTCTAVFNYVLANLSLNLLKKVTITTDAEGGSARPEIIATSNRVFVIYLGNIADGGNRTFNVKIFDSNLDNLIASKTLVTTTTEYGGPTDIRIASDGQYLYAFYETHKPTSQTTAITYLWGAKYTLSDSFDRVAYTSIPIASSKPMSELQDGGELLNDPAPLIGPENVSVITRLKYPLSMSGKTVYRVRGFTKDNLTRISEFDLDLSSVADGQGRVTSLLYWNNNIYIALATTVSDQGINDSTDDGALSNIIVVKMQQNWTFNAQTDVKTISAEANDVENYVSGFKADASYFYITYKQATGSPPTGEQIAWIKVFDGDFKLVLKEKVKGVTWGPGGGEIRPSLELIGNRIFSGQSSGQGVGTGNAEVYIYEKK